MNEADFKVESIVKADVEGYVKVDVVFNSSDKVYTFIRKSHENTVVIEGCRVRFSDYDGKLEATSIGREYDTKGRKRSTFGSRSKAEQKQINTIQEKEKLAEEVVEYSKEAVHEKYDQIKTCMWCNIPVYLAGPAGSGKNYTVEQIANEMGWNFYFSNSVQQEYKLTGFIDAGGKFHDTEFYKACTDKNECVFFLDEIDASIPEVLVLLNAAIANGYFEFPTGRVDFDKVHFVAAGNTVGTGADDLYSGRMVIDQATLDRFAIIEFGYDYNVEMTLTKGNEQLISFIRSLRTQAESKGIRATFSYRCMMMVVSLEEVGMPLKEVLKIAVFKGMDKDTINTMSANEFNNKYSKAFNELRAA